MNTFVDIHIIQNVPPSCVNRDDSGSPKTAVYGGVRRLRVSSQAWKRSTRLHFDQHLTKDQLGVRTKRVVETLAARIAEISPELSEKADSLAEKVFKAAEIKLATAKGKAASTKESTYLIFLSNSQIERLAQLAIDDSQSDEKLDDKKAQTIFKKKVKAIFKEEHAVDVSLFGRMVTDDADLNVDAACQVAHALSTHAAKNEYDFFTAVDDAKATSAEAEDAGAGMMGTVEFSSATLYRYATINLGLLQENLGSAEATLQAIAAFIDGFVRSMPTGKQNTFANRTLPDTIVVTIRDDQPVSYVGAFEEPVLADDTHGYVGRSVSALAAQAQAIEKNYGLAPVRSLVVSLKDYDGLSELGDRVSFGELLPEVGSIIESRLAPEQI